MIMKEVWYLSKEERTEFYRLMKMAKELSEGMEQWMQDHLQGAFDRKHQMLNAEQSDGTEGRS